MIINFTDFEIDTDLMDRVYKGIIPLEWERISFIIKNKGVKELTDTIGRINKWLFSTIEKRWAITYYYVKKNNEQGVNIKIVIEQGVNIKIVISFEYEHDKTTFILSDGINECHKSND